MDNELLVRIYNVGLGDCIYLRIPDKENGDLINRHVLIDCGNTYADRDVLKPAVENLTTVLNEDETNNQLDLLVVTHPHQDHIAGFDVCLEEFKNIKMGRVWLSASFDKEHEGAPKAMALHDFSSIALEQLSRLSLNRAFDSMVRHMLGLSNDGALEALRKTLPAATEAGAPEYVHDEKEVESIFSDTANIKFTILGPANDIDGEYLGKIEDLRRNFMSISSRFGMRDEPEIADNWDSLGNTPKNISRVDFRRLRERLFNNLLAFVFSDNVLINNTSVVLLLEWYGNRLLFTGDAQCKLERDGAYKRGSPNGSWNVMWEHHEEELNKPLDFLKIGHHGSHNATPWKYSGEENEGHPVNEIFDALVPEDPKTTKVVVSTERMKYPNIPHRHLMLELGRRILRGRKYDEMVLLDTKELGGQWDHYNIEDEIVPKTFRQPYRTDLEYQRQDTARVPWIDEKFKSK